MHATPMVPDFKVVAFALAGSLGALTIVLLFLLITQARGGFAAATGKARVRYKTVFLTGRLQRRAFYTILAMQFATASMAVIWLDSYTYMSGDVPAGHGGIAAYLSPDKSMTNVRLSRILACDLSDRFQLSALLDPPAKASPTLPQTEESAQFTAFVQAMEAGFVRQAPAAIKSLTEQLRPVFVVLGGLFLVIARGVAQQGSDDSRFPVRRVIDAGVLAFCFVFLAYFAILSYHASTEVARAFAAGRVVCTSHVAPFFIAQSQALTTAAVGLLILFVLSPRPIFRNL